MPYQFFFSYSRRNRNGDLDRFLAKLCEKVSLLKHVPQNELAFFDGDSIEVGAPWKPMLSTALRTSRVFLAICSPDYINSDYCGRELQVFLERYNAYVADENPNTPPKVILPILWGAPEGSLREVISKFQYTDNDFPAVYAQEGLRYMMELKAHDDDYTKFVTRLAHKIVDASTAHPLPDLAHLRPLDDVKSAFLDPDQQEAEAGDHAWFVFVAAKPGELKGSRASTDLYKKAGGRDWRPFYPDEQDSVGLMAQAAVAQYQRYFGEAPFSGDLLTHLQKAQANHEPVVILVDPWSLKLADYRAKMEALDQNILHTSAILVPWNAPDPETEAQRAALKTLLEQTFTYRAKVGRVLHYWGEVNSATALRSTLLEMLAHYTNKVLETTAARKKIPEEQVRGENSDTGISLDRPPLVANDHVSRDG